MSSRLRLCRSVDVFGFLHVVWGKQRGGSGPAGEPRGSGKPKTPAFGGFPKAPPAPRTWGKESVLWPRSFTTVSEELEVEELISFTISPVQGGEEEEGVKVISRLLSSLGIRACCPWGLALALRQRHPQLHGASTARLATSFRITESLRLEETSKIIKSSCQTIINRPAKPCPQVPHLHGF